MGKKERVLDLSSLIATTTWETRGAERLILLIKEEGTVLSFCPAPKVKSLTFPMADRKMPLCIALGLIMKK